MLEVVLTVRDERGQPIDAAAGGCRGVGGGDPGPTAESRGRSAQGAGPRRGGVRAGDAVPGGCRAPVPTGRGPAGRRAWPPSPTRPRADAGSDQVLDEVSCALVVSRRSAAHTRATAETLRHQPEVWAALCPRGAGPDPGPDPGRRPVRDPRDRPRRGTARRTTTRSAPGCWPTAWPTPRSTPPAAWSCSCAVGCWPSVARSGPDAAPGAWPSAACGSATAGTGPRTWSHGSPARTPNACTP